MNWGYILGGLAAVGLVAVVASKSDKTGNGNGGGIPSNLDVIKTPQDNAEWDASQWLDAVVIVTTQKSGERHIREIAIRLAAANPQIRFGITEGSYARREARGVTTRKYGVGAARDGYMVYQDFTDSGATVAVSAAEALAIVKQRGSVGPGAAVANTLFGMFDV